MSWSGTPVPNPRLCGGEEEFSCQQVSDKLYRVGVVLWVSEDVSFMMRKIQRKFCLLKHCLFVENFFLVSVSLIVLTKKEKMTKKKLQ